MSLDIFQSIQGPSPAFSLFVLTLMAIDNGMVKMTAEGQQGFYKAG
jgi:hypothetical protein